VERASPKIGQWKKQVSGEAEEKAQAFEETNKPVERQRRTSNPIGGAADVKMIRQGSQERSSGC
jgi:hypothetical protein